MRFHPSLRRGKSLRPSLRGAKRRGNPSALRHGLLRCYAAAVHPERRRRRRRRARNDIERAIAAICLLFLGAAPALGDSLTPPAEYAYTQLPDPRQEAEAHKLMQTLRCLVCQGQSIADSDAELAGDMRALVRRRIQAGETPEQIRAWLIERYGNWVTYEPPLEPITWPLWGAPIILLGAGLYLARGRFHRKASRRDAR